MFNLAIRVSGINKSVPNCLAVLMQLSCHSIGRLHENRHCANKFIIVCNLYF